MKKKYLIVVADYYKDIADGLISSALKIIPKKNIIKIIKVPGAFEIPVTISKNLKKYERLRTTLERPPNKPLG